MYFFSVSGSIYCIIRNTPPYGVDPRTRRTTIFSSDGRGQYVYEGLFIGALNIAAAVALILMTVGLPKVLVNLFFKAKSHVRGQMCCLSHYCLQCTRKTVDHANIHTYVHTYIQDKSLMGVFKCAVCPFTVCNVREQAVDLACMYTYIHIYIHTYIRIRIGHASKSVPSSLMH
jgi:hypothetical protein